MRMRKMKEQRDEEVLTIILSFPRKRETQKRGGERSITLLFVLSG